MILMGKKHLTFPKSKYLKTSILAVHGDSLNQNPAALLIWKAQCMQNVEKDHTD